jgi:voltage-gated potassium channel
MVNDLTLKEALEIRRRFQLLALAALSALLVGTIFMHFIEKLGWIDSLYFSVVSLTTVGYGDIAPKTLPGKVFVIFYLLVGVGILAAFASNLLRGTVARRVIRKNK